jgi:hypothetical protein
MALVARQKITGVDGLRERGAIKGSGFEFAPALPDHAVTKWSTEKVHKP